jgi:hypothetical protein
VARLGYFSLDKASPEREKEIIEIVAQTIVRKHDMGTMATLFLESQRPLVYVYGEMGQLFTPFLGVFGSDTVVQAEEYLITFKKRENIDQLVNRIREIQEEIEEEKGKATGENKTPNFIARVRDRVKSWFKKEL